MNKIKGVQLLPDFMCTITQVTVKNTSIKTPGKHYQLYTHILEIRQVCVGILSCYFHSCGDLFALLECCFLVRTSDKEGYSSLSLHSCSLSFVRRSSGQLKIGCPISKRHLYFFARVFHSIFFSEKTRVIFHVFA